MTNRTAPRIERDFAAATDAVRGARLRPEVRIEEIPAPQRIAPRSLAVSGEVVTTAGEAPAAAGRFVVLHDPAVPEAWESAWRVVTFARAEFEAEVAGDPLLGEVGWSWLTDALAAAPVAHVALGGTVTRVVSESFGALADRESGVEMEIRASWSPLDGADLGEHLRVWSEVMCTIAGMPPLPEGVSALPGQRRP